MMPRKTGRRRGSVVATKAPRKWRIVVSQRGTNGKHRQKWRTVHGTKKEAEQALTLRLRELDTGIVIDTHLTVGDWLDRWLRHTEGQVKPSTLRSYAQHVRDWIVPAFGWMRLEDLRADHIDGLMVQVTDSGRSASTAARVFATLRRALAIAERRGLLARNVARATEPPRQQVKNRRVDLDAVRKVLELADATKLGYLFRFLFATGLRRGEAHGLRWAHVDLEAGRINIVETAQRVTGKGFMVFTPKTASSHRTVNLDAQTIEILRRVRSDQEAVSIAIDSPVGPHTPVWAGDSLGYAVPETWTKGFKALSVRAGHPELYLHCLRHAHATALVELGAHARTIQQRLGHSSAAFTLTVYAHDSDGLDIEVANLFGMRFSDRGSGTSNQSEIEVSLEAP